MRDGIEQESSIKEVVTDDTVIFRSGEKVRDHGEIVDVQYAGDESMLTGASIQIDWVPGDSVIGATINSNRSLQITAHNVGKDTALSQIVRVVDEAQGSQAR